MAVVGPSRHSRVSMSVSMSLMQGGGGGTTGGGGSTSTHPSQAVLAAQPPPNYYHPAAPAPPQPPPAQDPVQPDRPIGYGAFGVVWYVQLIISLINSSYIHLYSSNTPYYSLHLCRMVI